MKMMEDMFTNIDYILACLNEHNDEIKPASMRVINNFWSTYHKKLVMAFLTWKEWHSFRRRMKALPPYEIVSISETHAVPWGEIIKKWSGSSYLFYLLIYFTRNVIFFRLVRPLMLKRKS